jgi:hypothetical protein
MWGLLFKVANMFEWIGGPNLIGSDWGAALQF